MYTPELGRWFNVDPLAEKYLSQSTYHFSGNNPMRFVDLNGMNYDGYTIDEQGVIERVNDTGGDDYDVLYTKKDYEASKETSKENGEKNEYGNPEPGNSIRVSSGTFSESNMFDLGNVRGVQMSNKSDAMAIYKFAADNFSVEFGLVSGCTANNNLSIVHTSGTSEFTRTPKVAKYMIDNGFTVMETDHSHPGGIEYGKPSGFDTNGKVIKPLEGDANAAKWIDTYNQSSVFHYMYHPNTGKMYQYNSRSYVEIK
jgi:hypothetical protein